MRNIEGAIYGGNHTHATISHCNISGNGPCGAIVIKDCDGIISNCLITDNNTFFRCGVFPVVFGCNGLIKNCTIANNISGVSVGTATIENCIIYNNTGSQLAVTNGNTVDISYCNVQDGLADIAGNGHVNWGPGNIDTDPCFVRLGYWEDEPLELV
ncbi:MAG: right-handed parallel beta-helix repeat-containing protein, partial [Planctomycetota bacterium]